MAIEKLTLDGIARLDDERIAKAFALALDRARRDCHDRPALEKARKVTLTILMTPCEDEDGSCGTVDVQFELDDNVPKRATRKYNMRSLSTGLWFNELSPDDVRQGTLDQVEMREVDGAS